MHVIDNDASHDRVALGGALGTRLDEAVENVEEAIPVGRDVGISVGSDDGLNLDGAAVGTEVGKAVGTKVGEPVGLCVQSFMTYS